MVDKWKGTKTTLESVDTTKENSPIHTPELLNTLSLPGIASYVLHPKIGTPVFLLRNMNHKVATAMGQSMLSQT